MSGVDLIESNLLLRLRQWHRRLKQSEFADEAALESNFMDNLKFLQEENSPTVVREEARALMRGWINAYQHIHPLDRITGPDEIRSSMSRTGDIYLLV